MSEGLAITVACGTGEGTTPLAAFDAALAEAGVDDYNLISMSSIIPPGSEVRRGTHETPPAEYGHRLFVVMARRSVSEAGHEAAAGLAWTQREDGRGLFVESTGTSRTGVRENLEATLRSMVERRGGHGEHFFETASIQCTDHPVCAVVVAVYRAEGWS